MSNRRGASAEAAILPDWPGLGHGRAAVEARRRARAGGVFGSLSARHAQLVWADARRQAYRALLGAGGVEGGKGEAADLVMVGCVAEHVMGCERCSRVARADGTAGLGVVADTPAEWLRWALWTVPRWRDVLRAVELPRRGEPPWATVVGGIGRVADNLAARGSVWAEEPVAPVRERRAAAPVVRRRPGKGGRERREAERQARAASVLAQVEAYCAGEGAGLTPGQQVARQAAAVARLRAQEREQKRERAAREAAAGRTWEEHVAAARAEAEPWAVVGADGLNKRQRAARDAAARARERAAAGAAAAAGSARG